MTKRNYSNTATEATLLVFLDATGTTFTLGNYAGFPTPPFTAAIDRGTVDEEIVLVTGVVGTTATVTRAYDLTTAKSHQAGAKFLHVVVAKDYDEAGAHTNATTGVHGVTGPLAGTTDVQTLTNKTLTSPTISAPTLTGASTIATANVTTLTVTGVTTLANATISGNATVGGTLGVTGALTATTAAFSGAITVQAPTLTTHPARKADTDALNTRLTTAEGTLTAAASAPANSVLVKYDGTGFFTVNTPTAAKNPAPKDYVDAGDTARAAGLIATASDSATASTAATAETRFTTSAANITNGVALVTGRAYEIAFTGKVACVGAAGVTQVNVRMSTTGTPTTTSTLVSSEQMSGTPTSVGYSVTTAGQPFQVSANVAAGSVHLFGTCSGASVTGMSILANAGGQLHVTVKDLGPAPTGLRTLTI